ncbi:tellurite resistance TerB C-terminal domain-containing protein [Anabaena cylindrica UHCC 0172]|uniref:tellurite resistance TerB C-terminal domain-containing protein n=1 Tax=Anabaena cylindrica TaxID=1165 RepID=UPI002B20DB17|nr:tellurite resistance TerB C-terminal domain-containing protein [Anabaena cylindrica]MEA5554079.1 tellurite resistance TerB C-terminal domain-containing protein [Anabaena cylindrica UHCC 0172]
MTLITTNSDNLTTLKPSKMHSSIISNRLILGISAFSVSFGLSLVPNWDFNKAFMTGLITVLATYCAALFVDKRRRNYEMLILSSLHKRIRELEGLKYRIVREIKQIEEHRNILYTESQHLQNQIAESRNQRDNLHREVGNFAGQKKQLESEISNLTTELHHLESNTEELNHTCADLTAEKRRLEINCNVSRSEITQLQTQIEAFHHEKLEIESNLTLLNRLKPQLEEKLYELRSGIQELEIEIAKQNNLLTETTTTRKIVANNLTDLQTQTQAQQLEINQLQNQIALLQDERDLLQNQVWELLQNMETLNQEELPENIQENEIELFPFDELLAPIDSQAQTSNLSPEWSNFLENLPTYEIQVLKAIVEEDNPKAIIKQIAEEHITMPNLLIDSINEIANNTLGELIIETGEEIPEIYQEHLLNVKKIIAMYEHLITKSTSPN